MSSTLIQKASFRDPASRLEKLVAGLEPKYQRQFLQMIKLIKDDLTVAKLTRLIRAGEAEEAFNVMRLYVERYADQINAGFIDSGNKTASFLQSKKLVVSFNVGNPRAVAVMQSNKLDLVVGFMAEQRQATSQALVAGVEAGLNPRAQARIFRDSIGLTSNQEAAVRNYGQMLRDGNSDALTRGLRDKRFDSTVQRSISSGKPLTEKQIGRMVERYQQRYIKYRSEVIARTEALSAANEGTEEMYSQAIESGQIQADKIEKKWHVSLDGRERDTHETMAGQRRKEGETFTSGAGVPLRYPGDRSAPGDERIQCRCAVSRVIKDAA